MLSIGGVSAATASLCLVAITHTYLLFHMYPYICYMAVTLPLPSKTVTVDSVGTYTGLLGTAFTTGRCLGFVPWKLARQRMAVKNTLLWSLGLSTLCSLWFGVSKTYLSALLSRFCLGLANTLSGCVKRIAIDREKAAASRAQEGESNVVQRAEMAPAKVLAVMWVSGKDQVASPVWKKGVNPH